jgi:hypothetical protein
MAAVLIQLALAGLLPAGARAASPDAAATAQAATAPYTSPTIEGCVLAAARVYRLPPAMLVILLNVEGGSLGRVRQNTNDTVDIGPMQVNQIWIPLVAAHWHAAAAATFRALRDNFCANVEAGAWILRHGLDEAGGDFWQGVGFYHSHDPDEKARYLRAVLRQAIRLRALAMRPAAAVHSRDAPAGQSLAQGDPLPADISNTRN